MLRRYFMLIIHQRLQKTSFKYCEQINDAHSASVSPDTPLDVNCRITCPFLSVIGQRVILNLRRFGARPDLTHDLSKEMDRQRVAMANELSCRQSGRGLEGGPTWEGASNGMIQMVDFCLDREANQRNLGKVSCKTRS